MRILFLTQRVPYAPNRGDRLRAWHILQHLAQKHDVMLVALAHDREEAARVSDLAGVARTTVTAPIPRLGNLARAAIALSTSRPLTHVLLDSPAILPAIRSAVGCNPPNVVLAYCSSMARFALEEPLREIPLVVDMVDADSAKWSDLAATAKPPLKWIYNREARYLGRFEAEAMRHAKATLVVNDRDGDILRRLAPDATITVLSNGVDAAYFAPPDPPAERPTAVFCGVMDYPPNEAGAVWMARHVWPLVRREQPQATLWLVGARPTARVRGLASTALGIEVTGTVADVRPYLWRAAVACAPLHTARGVQNKVLEAIAARLPVVVTSAVWHGLPPEVHPACRVADEAPAFSASMLDALRASPAERRLRACGADIVSISWPSRLAPLDSILESAAAKPGV